MKKLAIMQPYFFPYIGYFQLIHAVDEFIIYDNIEYTKKGWINRNQISNSGSNRIITLPIKKASDYLNIIDRELAPCWDQDKEKMLNLIKSSYCKSPFFKESYNVIERCLMYEDANLFNFVFNSVKSINEYLNIQTPITVSSSLGINHELTGKDKIISICKNQHAPVYINAIGGVDLYSKDEFQSHNIRLNFIKPNPDINKLSIIDLMMSKSKGDIQEGLQSYKFV